MKISGLTDMAVFQPIADVTLNESQNYTDVADSFDFDAEKVYQFRIFDDTGGAATVTLAGDQITADTPTEVQLTNGKVVKLKKQGASNLQAATFPSSGPAQQIVTVFKATSAGVNSGDGEPFPSTTTDFTIVAHPTAPAPRIALLLPSGKTLVGVWDNGQDITSQFTQEVGNAERYVMNQDFGAGDVALLVRISE